MEEQEDQEKELSIRTTLIKVILEHFLALKDFEMLETKKLETDLSDLLKYSLAFETRVEVNHDPETIDKSIFAGTIYFLEEADKAQEQNGFQVIEFNVMPRMM